MNSEESGATIARFAVSGGVSTAAYLLIALVLNATFPGQAVIVNTLAYGVCIVISFVLQRNFTFRSAGTPRVEFPKFVAVSAAGMALSVFLVAILTESVKVPAILTFVFIAMVLPVFNFLMLRNFVFKRSSGRPHIGSSD